MLLFLSDYTGYGQM